jgi:hypothetical protein
MIVKLAAGLAIFVVAAAAAADRFVLIMEGAAVKDNHTGLVWEQTPGSDHVFWIDALTHCDTRATGGRTGWRIPTKEELAGLVDASRHDPALPGGHPFSNVKSAIYWTSTPSAKDPVLAWHVSFFSGEVATDGKHLNRRVWCVRSGETK